MSVTSTTANASAQQPRQQQPLPAPGAGKTTSVAGAGTSRPRAGMAIALVYIALALIALIPGAILKLDLQLVGPPLDDLLEELRPIMLDVRFGFGARFWVGVAGTVMLGLLLLYPLRKALGKSRLLGSISGWFHIHLLLGLAGPVLIIYHANFGHGDTNGTVALWTMLAVTVSGIVGHFVYASASAEFYSGKHKALEQIDAIADTLGRLNAMHSARQNLIDELDTLQTELLTPRRGVIASIKARLEVEQRYRYFKRAAHWLIAQSAHQLGMSIAERDRLLATVGGHLDAYLHIARHAASRSVREQIWARWRLFHLPVFLIMSIAMTLHIVAVWKFDVPLAQTPPEIGDGSVAGFEPVAEAEPGQVPTPRFVTSGAATPGRDAGRAINDLIAKLPAEESKPATANDARPDVVASSRPTRATRPRLRKVETIPIVPGAAAQSRPVLVAKPKRAARPGAGTLTPAAKSPRSEFAAAPQPTRARRPVNRVAAARPEPARQAAKPAADASQRPRPAEILTGTKPGSVMERFDGVWVEGPGFDITYGGTYDGCTRRCLGNPSCVMLEYYRPQKKCNLYDAIRPRKSGGNSIVGIRRSAP